MKSIRQILVLAACLAATGPASASLMGPVWASGLLGGGSESWSGGSDLIGRDGGLRIDYTVNHPGMFLELRWGPAETEGLGLGLSLDGAIDEVGEVATAFSCQGDAAVWTGQTSLYDAALNQWVDVATMLEVKLFDGESGEIGFAADGGLALGCLADVTGRTGFWAQVSAFALDGGEEKAGWVPFLDFYDQHSTLGNQAIMSFNDGFYYSPVPEPSAMLTLGAGLLALAILRRRIKR